MKNEKNEEISINYKSQKSNKVSSYKSEKNLVNANSINFEKKHRIGSITSTSNKNLINSDKKKM